MIKKLLFLSFVEGAVVMASELCGAKLLSPMFGSSLYVWSSVMAITLTALAFGYFFGGIISSRRNDSFKSLYLILVAASFFVLLMPVLNRYLIPWISYLPFLLAVVLSTLILLFFPVFLLGASSPLFISLQAKNNEQVGKISGIVYAVSTLGGIMATFMCGFYLIPVIGLTYCLVLFGFLLFIFSSVLLKTYKLFNIFLFLLFIYLNLQFAILNKKELLYSDSMLGQLEVLDMKNKNKDMIRILKINGIIQTEMNLKTRRSISDYVNLLDTLIPFSTQTKRALVLGLGGGLTSNLCVTKNYVTDGVEIDGKIIKAANTFFFLSNKVNCFEMDARYFLNSCEKKYDLVLVDIFKAEEQPSHVITLESLNTLKNNLSDSAILIINWHGYLTGEKGIGTSILNNTLVKAGYEVKICTNSHDENYRNLLFICSLKTLAKMPFQIEPNFEKTDLVNTDNLQLFEMYNALVNKTWRTNYLKYYQNKSVN